MPESGFLRLPLSVRLCCILSDQDGILSAIPDIFPISCDSIDPQSICWDAGNPEPTASGHALGQGKNNRLSGGFHKKGAPAAPPMVFRPSGLRGIHPPACKPGRRLRPRRGRPPSLSTIGSSLISLFRRQASFIPAPRSARLRAAWRWSGPGSRSWAPHPACWPRNSGHAVHHESRILVGGRPGRFEAAAWSMATSTITAPFSWWAACPA